MPFSKIVFKMNINVHEQYKIPQGKWTVWGEGAITTEILSLAHEIIPLDIPENNYHGERGKRLLLVRAGAVGDLLMLTPIFRELHARECRVTVVTRKQYMGVLYGNPHIYRQDTLPFSMEILDDIDHVISFADLLQDDDPLFREDGITRLAARAGITLTNYQPEIEYDDIAQAKADTFLSRFDLCNRKIVIAQAVASRACRSWPVTSLTDALAIIAAETGAACFITGHGKPRPLQLIHGRRGGLVIDIRGSTPFFQSLVAICRRADLIIGPDSALLHIAAGLGLPGLGFFGPIPASARIANYPTVQGIDSPLACAPCGLNRRCSRMRPGATSSPCLRRFSSNFIAKKALALLK